MNIKNKLLEAVESIYSYSKDCKLDKNVFEVLDGELSVLSKKFEISKVESFFLALFFAMNLEVEWVSMKNLKDHLDTNSLNLIKYNKEICLLINKNYLEEEENSNITHILKSNTDLRCNQTIWNEIAGIENQEDSNKSAYQNRFSFIEEVYKSIVKNDRERESQKNISEGKLNAKLYSNLNVIFAKHSNHELNSFFEEHQLTIENKIIFMYILWRALRRNSDLSVARICEYFYGNNALAVEKIMSINCKENELIKNDWLELQEEFFGVKVLILTYKAKKELHKIGITLFEEKEYGQFNKIEPKNINKLQLYYNERSSEQIEQLQSILQDNQLNIVQQNLISKGLPQGITTIFYGPPGTGKTETVLQLAKKSNRMIMKVNISEMKSMWYGESQKLVKGVFEDYRELCQASEKIPILFFNEADAVFASRSSAHTGRVAQTENEIQNILLDELENFEGLLMATTNLEDNMDKAFERRFLFKIELNKPSDSIKARIWKSKIPDLSQDEAEKLACDFDFSGGQINNIVRKKEMYEALHNKSIIFDEIINYCKEETYAKEEASKVGFKK